MVISKDYRTLAGRLVSSSSHSTRLPRLSEMYNDIVMHHQYPMMTHDSSVRTINIYGLNDWGSILFDTSVSRPTLGRIQTHIQWAPRVISSRIK
jgi:hypothetical protein